MVLRSSFPKEILPLYTDVGIRNRLSFDATVRQFMLEHLARPDLTPFERDYIHNLRRIYSTYITAPCATFLADAPHCFDVIAVSVARASVNGASAAVLFVEDYSHASSVRRGAGKTALALNLCGVKVQLDDIPRPESRHDLADIERAIRVTIARDLTAIPVRRCSTRLVLTDVAYLGTQNGRLFVSAVIGEPFIAQWDVARHIVRHFDAYYKTDDGARNPKLEEYLKAVAARHYLPFGTAGVFHDGQRALPVKAICIVDPCILNSRIVTRFSDSKHSLEELLLANPCKHPAFKTSRFWRIDVAEHARRVKLSMQSLYELPLLVRMVSEESTTSKELMTIEDLWQK